MMSVIATSINNEIDRLFRGRNRQLAVKVIGIIEELDVYWPLTVRQVFYQCVSQLLIPNLRSAYGQISKMLTTLRRNDLLLWDAIEDRTRRTTDKRGVSGLAEFIEEQAADFLNWQYFHRCRVQEQDVYLEVATEKDALSSIMEEVVWPYCCRLNVCKGQVSASMIEKMASRFEQADDNGQESILLYFGDLDPSGVAIPKAIQRNLLDHHGVDIKLVRVGLNPDQLEKYSLPVSPDAAKHQDPNYDAWIREYGGTSPTELDALHPRDLEEMVRTAIEDHLDMASFNGQIEIEKIERNKLKRMRRKIMTFARAEYPGYFK